MGALSGLVLTLTVRELRTHTRASSVRVPLAEAAPGHPQPPVREIIGRACVFTTVVIAGGFWILMLSQFLPTAYFGGLVGFTMLGTLAADLLLLPVLITTFRVFDRLA